MITNLTPEQITRGKAGMAALRANEKKATQVMRDHDGGRCCLCVLYDAAQEMGANLPDLDDEKELPPHEIKYWYGWWKRDPRIDDLDASAHNDGSGTEMKTHLEIADLFEVEFPQLKEGA